MSKARQDLGTRIQRGDHAQRAGSLVPEAAGAHRSPAARFAVDEPNQGKANSNPKEHKLRCRMRVPFSSVLFRVIKEYIYIYRKETAEKDTSIYRGGF